MLPNAKSQAQFLTWVKKRHPGLYNAIMAGVYEPQLSGFGADEPVAATPSLWEKLTTGLTSLGTTYLTLKNQRDAMKLNLARAEQGLPPVDAGVTAPVVRTQIDLPPDVLNKLTADAGAQFNKVLLIGAAALAAFLIIKKK